MRAETMKELNEAKGTINIDIHGLEPRIKMSINNPHCLFIAAKVLISSIAHLGGISEAEAIAAVTSFISDTKSCVADSQEQVDIMKEILKRGGEIHDFM